MYVEWYSIVNPIQRMFSPTMHLSYTIYNTLLCFRYFEILLIYLSMLSSRIQVLFHHVHSYTVAKLTFVQIYIFTYFVHSNFKQQDDHLCIEQVNPLLIICWLSMLHSHLILDNTAYRDILNISIEGYPMKQSEYKQCLSINACDM